MEHTRQHTDEDAIRRLKRVIEALFPDTRVVRVTGGIALQITFEGKLFERRFADRAECSRHAKGAMREMLHEIFEHLWSPEAHMLEVEVTSLQAIPEPAPKTPETKRPATMHTPAPTGHKTMAVSQRELQARLELLTQARIDPSRATTSISPDELAAHLIAAKEQNAPLRERCLQGLRLLGFPNAWARKRDDERFGFVLEPGSKEVLTDITQLTADLPGTLQWIAANHPNQR